MSNSKKTLKKNKKFIQNSGAFVDLKNNYIYFLATIRSFFKNKNFLKHFGFIYGLYFIGIFGLLIADVYHGDDIWRMQQGNPDYFFASRHLSQILSYFFHASYPKIADISPLSQLIAIAFLSIGSMVLVKVVNNKITYLGLTASLLLGLNPWYLQCIAYKFDSIFMALATLCAIFPFLFKKRASLFFIVSVFLLVCMWNLYQANNGIYIVTAFFIIVNLIVLKMDLKQILKFLFLSALAFIVSALIYKIFFFIEPKTGSYIGKKIGTIGAGSIIPNIKELFITINSNLGNHTIKYLFLLTIPFFILSMFQRRKTNCLITTISVFVFLSVGLVISYGAYLGLSKFDQDPRAIAQIGGFLAIIAIVTVSIKHRIITILSKCIVSYMAYALITISNSYANALDMQVQFISYRINLMISDLEHLLPVDPKENVSLRIKSIYIPEPFRSAYSNVLPLFSKHTSLVSVQNVNRSRHRGINTVIKDCRDKDDKPIKIFETRFHKIQVFENNCYEVSYK